MNNPIGRGLKLLRIGWQARKMGQSHSDAERLLAQRALTAMFAEARGVTMKIGQLFADSDEATPFRELLDNIEPLPLETVLPLIDRQLGRPYHEVFEHIEASSAAASLGQVHHARFKQDGSEVAIKIRYPDIRDAVESELRLAGLMPGMGPVKKWGFDLLGYKEVLKQNMDRELDYRSEAQRQQAFAQGVMVDGLVVPKVYPELCREALLVQSWEGGESLEQAKEWPIELRQQLSRILIKTLLTSLFHHGQVHGDPHSGNYLFRRGGHGVEVALLDYGCTIEVNETARLALLKLILAMREGRDISPLQCFAAMGFDEQKLGYIAPTLPLVARILLRPFHATRPLRMEDWPVSQPMSRLLGDKRWWFRSAGPPQLLLLLRAFQGLSRQLQSLEAYQDWWTLIRESLGDELLQRAREFQLPPLSRELSETPGLQAIADTLHVEVLKNGSPHVKVSLPAEAALDLAELMPEEVLEQLQGSGEIDLEAIQQRVNDSGIAPQDVFDYSHADKHYRVWLS
ncbi:MAG: ABC transporter [Gammaproteobacteria bacterium]|nr:ABC transporter [Gammaproteobacteria bacterium]